MRAILALLLVMFAAAATSLGAAVPDAEAEPRALTPLDQNLLLNPGAEKLQGAPDGYTLVPIRGWTQVGNFTVAPSGSGGFPSLERSLAFGGGKYLFAGGPNNSASRAYQVRSIADRRGLIDAEKLQVVVSAWLAGWDAQRDSARVVVEFLGENDQVLGSLRTAAVSGGSEEFRKKTATGVAPRGTRKLKVVLVAARGDGDYNDGYFDKLDLRIARVAEVGAATAAGFRDNFSTKTLNARWTWFRENTNNWSLTARRGSLRIMGVSDIVATCAPAQNILLQKPPRGNYSVTLGLTLNPTQNYQQAGLILFRDANNYVKLDFVYSTGLGGRAAEFIKESKGIFPGSWQYIRDDASKGARYLRITVVGSRAKGWFSTNGVAWRGLGFLDMSGLVGYRIGLFAFRGCGTGARPAVADFDYVDIQSLPLVGRSTPSR